MKQHCAKAYLTNSFCFKCRLYNVPSINFCSGIIIIIIIKIIIKIKITTIVTTITIIIINQCDKETENKIIS